MSETCSGDRDDGDVLSPQRQCLNEGLELRKKKSCGPPVAVKTRPASSGHHEPPHQAETGEVLPLESQSAKRVAWISRTKSWGQNEASESVHLGFDITVISTSERLGLWVLCKGTSPHGESGQI
jgi:hypothetical protein